MKKKIAIIMLALSMLLGGCGQKLTEGEIYEMEFLPEYTQTVLVPIVHTNGKTSYTTLIPIIQHYPDRWKICIRSLEKSKDGDYETAIYYTTEEVYNECSVGDMFSYDSKRDYDEEPVKKEKAN